MTNPMPTRILEIQGIAIEVPVDPPQQGDCPVQSCIDCPTGLWYLDTYKDEQRIDCFGPESFVTAFYRALMRDQLGEVAPDRIVIRWAV